MVERSMTTREIMKLSKDVVRAYFDDDKMYRERPKRAIISDSISEERQNLLRGYAELLIRTDYVNKYMKDYLLIYERYEDVARANKSIRSESEISSSSVKSSIWYEVKKIKSDFGDRFLYDVLYYHNKDISIYVSKLNELRSKYGQCIVDVMKKNLSIEIPYNTFIYHINDTEFKRLLSIIKPYFQKEIINAVNSITQEMAGYYWFLLHNGEYLTGLDRDRYLELKDNTL